MTLMTVLFPNLMKVYRLAVKRAETEVDTRLRYVGMLWRSDDIWLACNRYGVQPRKTNGDVLEEVLVQQLQAPRTWLDSLCYRAVLGRVLKGLDREARREARARLKRLEASFVDKVYDRGRTAGPNSFYYQPYKFVMPLDVTFVGSKQIW